VGHLIPAGTGFHTHHNIEVAKISSETKETANSEEKKG
jgi:hypothetical protein